ncbi:MAG TPA: hypothetical protein PLN20_05155 [Thermotogota bacterium]|jgi:hypothetical protein|nr:hypothetical protein [Thermotogota bacterium]NLH18702.1 hypothetical protein [Thermotogaceae bacterium]OQC30290.1 MAG: hypothetical protein BWX67_01854 [Thermotogota bacterium ADurb.Bin062]HNW47152.1 hypothetical protein [Thermotogota bacterium]HNY82919.1 hypothetical protein [Thermotogota bacterium]
MDVAAIVLSALTCFFILMGNFKISRLGEEQEKRFQETEHATGKLLQELQNLRSEWYDKAKELSLELSKAKTEIGDLTMGKSNVSTVSDRVDFEDGIRRLDKRLDSLEQTIKSLEGTIGPLVIRPLSQEKRTPVGSFDTVIPKISLVDKIKQKYPMLSTDEKLFLNTLFRKTECEWHKTEDLGLDASTAKFLVPMVGRKLVFSGVPLIKIKDINGTMKVLWGEGLRGEDVAGIAEAFVNEVHV